MKKSYQINSFVWQDPWCFVAFGFGVGVSPIAPGTVGSLVALPFSVMLANLPLWLYVSALCVAFFLGCVACSHASKQLGVPDYGGLVWDEFVGLWVTFLAVPCTWPNLLLGFVLFRFFDILKPWPIKWFDENVHGGLGVMLDDVIAGFCACGVLQLANVYFANALA
jgi:phosphatidylglycerophosphatase A